MTGPNKRAAFGALTGARAIVDRLDSGRDPEDLAADLIEGWGATENALRSMMGGSALAGQPLITALRQRNMLSLDQAHALLEFLAARDRAQRTEYQPSAVDVAAARDAFTKLEQGAYAAQLGAPSLADTSMFQAVPGPGSPTGPAPPRVPPVFEPIASPPRQPIGFIAGIVVFLALAAGLAWYLLRGRGSAPAEIASGVSAYGAGRLERARQDFATAAREHPDLALPHVWLGRVARDQREDATAATEYSAAERLEPNNAVVHREIGAFHLARGRYDEARKRYIRAVELDPADRTAQGWLGCALARLGRPDQAQTWWSRAGAGDWTRCAAAAPAGAPAGAGATVPRGPA